MAGIEQKNINDNIQLSEGDLANLLGSSNKQLGAGGKKLQGVVKSSYGERTKSISFPGNKIDTTGIPENTQGSYIRIQKKINKYPTNQSAQKFSHVLKRFFQNDTISRKDYSSSTFEGLPIELKSDYLQGMLIVLGEELSKGNISFEEKISFIGQIPDDLYRYVSSNTEGRTKMNISQFINSTFDSIENGQISKANAYTMLLSIQNMGNLMYDKDKERFGTMVDFVQGVSEQLSQKKLQDFYKNTPPYVEILEANAKVLKLKTVETDGLLKGATSKSIETSFNTQLGEISFIPEEGDSFISMEWEYKSIKNNELRSKGFLSKFGATNVAVIRSNNDIVYVIPSQTGDGFATVCESGQIAIYDKDNRPSGGITARKPVIYLYPKKTSTIDVAVHLKDAEFLTTYPKINDNTWSVSATPKGKITDLTNGKKYNYLFWEAFKKDTFNLDVKKSYCIKNTEVEVYLENTLKTFGLNSTERNDFIVYWLPILEQNPYSVIEWKKEEYEQFAKLDIMPTPDSIIRVFMVFKRSEKIVHTGSPKLKTVKRKGFSVVEWGGANLDEINNKIA